MVQDNLKLLRLLQNGDEASFKVVYNHYYSRLYFFVSEYIPNKDIVENVLQDTFMTLWEKKKELKPDTNLNAYLYTVAKNNSLKKLRDSKYRNTLFESGQITELELNLNFGALEKLETSDLIFSEIETIITETLSSLPPQCKQVFELSRFQQKKNAEIADELGISVKTVEGHITKAIKIFKKSLKDYLPLIGFFIS